ncbi:polyprenyl diphosphate synthase [Geoglobus acetivorans]|uniref:polyprenyl diphosphate synthase n=1 Tax=Geoglobus acetivorans TaxID=565033 RepID=UPI00064EF279
MIAKIYELRLLRNVRKGEIPKHVAIIMDGNRRYARKRGMPSHMGHFFGSRKAEKVLDWCREIGVRVVTLYAFSTENFRRSEEEKRNIFDLFRKEMNRLLEDPRTHRNRMRVRVVGYRGMLPDDLVEVIERVERKTAGYDRFFLNIAFGYGGRQEIIDAVRNVLRKVREGKIKPDDIDERLISHHLYSDNGYENVDILIRTGGEQRLSNFLPWQCANSITYFVDVYWPAFRKIDLLRAIRTWQSLRARYYKAMV